MNRYCLMIFTFCAASLWGCGAHNETDTTVGPDLTGSTDSDTQPTLPTDGVENLDTTDNHSILSIIALREDDHNAPFTSMRLNSQFVVPNHNGVEVTARLKLATRACDEADPFPNGTWPAFWMLGDDSSERGYGGSAAWPACGEIDIVEWVGTYDDDHFQTNQWGDGGFAVDQDSPARHSFTPDAGPETWHIYGMRFEEETIVFTFDGVDVAERSYNDPAGHGHRIILNLAIGGKMAGTVADSFQSDMLQIDWVRVKDQTGAILFADEMDSEAFTKENWFTFVGKAYNNEEQYYTNWESDNYRFHNDQNLGQCP